MENKVENNTTTEVTEVKKEKMTVKERIKKIDWKKIGIRAINVAEVLGIGYLGYRIGKRAANQPIPVEGTVEETEDDILDSEEEEA